MSSQNFLITALTKSFQKPVMKEYNNIDFIFCRDSSGNFLMGDKSDCHFAPYIISNNEINNFIASAEYDVKHCPELNKEYEQFKHYFEENIIIPETSTMVQSLRLWLNLTSVSRHAAQKKRIIATIMPSTFQTTLAEMEKGFREALNKIKICQQENLDSLEIALITDFKNSYYKMLCKFHYGDLLFLANKIRLHKYLIEALNIIERNGQIDVKFELSHIFLGHNKKHFINYADSYRNDMLILINKLSAMGNNHSLLSLVRIFLCERKRFNSELKNFSNSRRAPNLNDILEMKTAAQTMYNEFAKLCYFEGVRRAFEVNYLDQCPTPQNPPLPSVAPNEEIGKIRNIVEESKLISCQKTRLGKTYLSALENYRISREKIDKILIDYIGIPNSCLNKDIV